MNDEERDDGDVDEASEARVFKGFRLRVDLLEDLKKEADRQNRSLNNYVENLLLIVMKNIKEDEAAYLERKRRGNMQ